MTVGRTRLVDRSTQDQLIIGTLLLFILVYAMELALLLPCGGWDGIDTCDIPDMALAMWSDYFKLDPLWSVMPPWFEMTMTLQDLIFNPWWCLALFMFWTNRQDAKWFGAITCTVCGMMIASTSIYFFSEYHYTETSRDQFTGLLLINGPWMVAPFLLVTRLGLAREKRSSGDVSPASGSTAKTSVVLAVPILVYVLLCMIAVTFYTPQ